MLIIFIVAMQFELSKPVKICLNKESLQIPKTAAVSWGPERLKNINLLIPVDCKTEKVLVPKSNDEYLQFLDLALPINLKSGAVQGCGSRATNNSVYTVYRYNADWVALERLGEYWKKSPACQSILTKNAKAFPVDCAVSFYNEYRANFMPRDSFSLDRNPAQIPTAAELDAAAKNDPKCKE